MLRILVILFLIAENGLCRATSNAPSSDTNPDTAASSTDGLKKRNVKVENILGKSYDPAPEYYRPRERESSAVYSNDERSRTKIAFPTKRYSSKTFYNNNNNKPNIQNRIGEIGHFHSSQEYTGYGGLSYEPRYPQSGSHSYSPDYGHHFESTAYGGAHLPVLTGHHSVANDATADLYHKGSGWDYGYPTSYGDASHNFNNKIHLAKQVLLPIAGAAALGLAAALFVNPVLLQLGTTAGIGASGAALGVGLGKRRRRRDLEEKLSWHDLAFRHYRN